MAFGDFLYQHHDGSSLIVDFPPVPRRQIGESRRHHAVSTIDDSSTIEVTQQPMMKRSKKVKSVSFSATSTMVLMPPKSKQELASVWYSGEEKMHFKKMVLLNAAEVTSLLESSRPDDLTDEVVCNTVGMENFLNPRLMRMTKLEKQRHAQSIVFAQARCDPDLLSQFSQRSSQRSRERAHARASSQF